MIKLENLYKLNTNEDSTYIHKYLGSICLINYGYRYINYLFFNSMNLSNNLGQIMLFTHGLLSISSMIFHLPSLRNPAKPMIYPEFRLHSIVFGLRSIIISFLYAYNFHYLYIVSVCYLTFIMADIITYNYNINGKNGQTMRNMPFDNSISKEDQNKITFMHSCMQIGATIFMLGNIETAFSPLFAIQLAALLMTLVRKSIISSKMWHSVYSISLWINIILFKTLPLGYILINQIMYYNYRFIFFPNRINKYIGWTINFSLYAMYKEYYIEDILSNYTENYIDAINWIKLGFIVITGIRFFMNYKILFM